MYCNCCNIMNKFNTQFMFCRGYGFVRFSDEMEHRKAMIDMQGAVGCGSKPLRVSAATPKR